jgi:hypothetical protein
VKTIRVDVKVQSERELKIVWNDEQGAWHHYLIHRKAVEIASAEIRAVLLKLVGVALKKSLDDSGALLKELATSGAKLYRTLFAAMDDAKLANRIRVRYEEETDFRLRFNVSASVYAPWGLVYPATDDEVDALPDVHDVQTLGPYAKFWCMSRELATVYDGIPPDVVGRNYDASTLGMIRVVNDETFQAIKSKFSKGSPESEMLDWFHSHYGAPVLKSKDLERAWRDKGSRTGLLYFYCHANATKLALSDEEKIASSDLFLMLSGSQRAPKTSGCLVVINGCSTAVGDPSGDFLLAASQEGLCGFIGTETDVPDVFALRFSLVMLDLLFRQGLTLSEAMLQLHRNHFPLSLLYGLYAHPDFRMPQAGSPAFAAPKNLSFESVGSGRLEANGVI